MWYSGTDYDELIAFLAKKYRHSRDRWQKAADEAPESCWLVEHAIFHAEQHLAVIDILRRDIEVDLTGADSTFARALLREWAREFEDYPAWIDGVDQLAY